jgi:hypothetical protein
MVQILNSNNVISYLKSFVSKLFRITKFISRALYVRRALYSIDKKNPFGGKMSEYGFHYFLLSQSAITQLRKTQSIANGSENLVLTNAEIPAIKELFAELKPVVRDYLGEDCFLDGMHWRVTTAQQHGSTDVNGSWHIDNVGNRIKVFVCVEGDGTQPTQIIASKSRTQPFLLWIKDIFFEATRWSGSVNKIALKDQFSCRHETGTAYLFDTELLHRGSYETGSSNRVILHMEFSKKSKHFLKGAYSKDDYLKFQFSPEFLKLEPFCALLDQDRLKKGSFTYPNWT